MTGSVTTTQANEEYGSHAIGGGERNVSKVAGKVDLTQLLFPQWDIMLRRVVSTVMFRFQQFIQDDSELRVTGPVFKQVKKEMMLKADERDVMRWWQTRGKPVYRRSLSQKRQTLCNSLKLLVIGMCYEKWHVCLFQVVKF